MTISRLLGMASFVAVLAVFAIPTVTAQFQKTSKWVPDEANTLVMVRVKQVMGSDIASKEKWSSDRTKAFQSGANFIPPWADRLLIASHTDFQYFEPAWRVVVYEQSRNEIEISKVSQRVGGNIESISGKDAILLPNDAYLVEADTQTLVSMAPANRQATARWLRDSMASKSRLSDYLAAAVRFADKNADVIAAFDLADVASPDRVEKRLVAAGKLSDAEVATVLAAVTKINGATLGITINNKITGAIKIDFDGAPTAVAPLVKKVMFEALRNHGLMIDDFEDWELKVNPNQIVLMGGLSAAGLRQIASLIESPVIESFTSAQGGDVASDMKTCSKQYYDALNSLIEEMRERTPKATSLKPYTKWFERYSRKIDALSILNVDPALLQFGQYTSSSFRDTTKMLLQTDLQKNVAKSSYNRENDWYSYGYGRYGSSYSYDGRGRQRRDLDNQARQQGEIGARALMDDVLQKKSEVRQMLTAKYKINF